VVPTGERWLCEIKHDGYRIHAHQAEWKAALTAATPMVIFISFPRQ
jgi:ATP-dependent DNA ligase